MNPTIPPSPVIPNSIVISENTPIATSSNKESSTNTSIVSVDVASKAPLPFSAIRIDDKVFFECIQDTGCSKENLQKSTYRQNKIPAYGPKDMEVYYPQLSAIAIDFLKNIKMEKANGRGWKRLPTNPTDVKVKLIEILLSLRRIGDVGEYNLTQDVILGIISTQWGEHVSSADKTEDNDKLRLFGLLFLEQNLDKLHRLSLGVTGREQLEDPDLLLKGLFQLLAMDYNNENVRVHLPLKASDINDAEIDYLDANDETRIRIQRDGNYAVYTIITYSLYIFQC